MGATSVTGVGTGSAFAPGDGRTHLIKGKPEHPEPTRNSVWLETSIKFIKTKFDEIVKDDMIYYQILRHSDGIAHGPFLVVDKEPFKIRLRNGQGVEFNFNETGRLQWLKIDLISLINGSE